MTGATPQGRLIAVVGPSGVGKDRVMDAMTARHPCLGRVRRAVTRPAAAGGEDILSLKPAEFEAAQQRGDFLLHWQAHGLAYGVPVTECAALTDGRDLMVNLSRAVLAEAARLFPTLTVLSLTARTDVLARRLAARGRESRSEIAARLSRWIPIDAGDAPIVTVDNSGDLEITISTALAALYPAAPGVSRTFTQTRNATEPK